MAPIWDALGAKLHCAESLAEGSSDSVDVSSLRGANKYLGIYFVSAQRTLQGFGDGSLTETWYSINVSRKSTLNP